jgi:hypothetical protein
MLVAHYGILCVPQAFGSGARVRLWCVGDADSIASLPITIPASVCVKSI